jgi:L-alanine-DL-glutamate epimerase-like enolase superfamily enzyme
MKIASVRAIQPRTPRDPQDWRTTVGQILAVVDLDNGVRGFGVGGGGAAGIHVVEQVLRDLVMGEDPSQAEALWERMYRATEPYGRKGLAVMAISALDNAIWDAWGKAEGLSVARLLGAPKSTRIPCYATTPGPLEAVKLGFRAVKLHFQPSSEDDAIERVRRVRESIGAEVRLFTDTHGHWDFDATLRLAAAFARHDVGWMEEPLPELDVEAYGELCRRSPVPIAGGEHEYTARGFRELARHRAHHIWQPDATWTGGMTQMKAIYELGRREGVRVCPHRGAEVWGLHAIAALDDEPLAESPRPWIDWLRGQPEIVDGFVEVPDRPGFGVEVAPDLIGF